MTLVLDEGSILGYLTIETGDLLMHILSHLPKNIRTIAFQIGQWPQSCASTAECLVKTGFASFWEKLDVSLSELPSLLKIEFWFVIPQNMYEDSWTDPMKKHLAKHFKKGLITCRLRYDLAPMWAQMNDNFVSSSK